MMNINININGTNVTNRLEDRDVVAKWRESIFDCAERVRRLMADERSRNALAVARRFQESVDAGEWTP